MCKRHDTHNYIMSTIKTHLNLYINHFNFITMYQKKLAVFIAIDNSFPSSNIGEFGNIIFFFTLLI